MFRFFRSLDSRRIMFERVGARPESNQPILHRQRELQKARLQIISAKVNQEKKVQTLIDPRI